MVEPSPGPSAEAKADILESPAGSEAASTPLPLPLAYPSVVWRDDPGPGGRFFCPPPSMEGRRGAWGLPRLLMAWWSSPMSDAGLEEGSVMGLGTGLLAWGSLAPVSILGKSTCPRGSR